MLIDISWPRLIVAHDVHNGYYKKASRKGGKDWEDGKLRAACIKRSLAFAPAFGEAVHLTKQ